MSSWRECKLGDVAEIVDSLHKTPKEYFTNGYPMVRVTDVKKGKLNLSQTLKVNKETFEEFSKKYKPKKDDIIFTRVGSYGNTCIVGDDINFCLGQNTVFIIARENAKFLYYFFNSPVAKVQIEASAGGSTQPTVSLKSIREYDILLPPLEEQKAIAEVLSSLDDKIDLLNRQNQTLESLAQTLFRQWFGSETLVSPLDEAKASFPNRENWEEKPLSEIADFLNGLACQKFPPQNDIDKLPVLKIKDLKDGINENSDWTTSDIKHEYIVNNGDVIFAWSASLMVKIWNGEKCVLNQHLFKVTSKYYPKWFYYFWCKYHLDNFIDIASEHATTMGHIKRSDLDEAICLVPNIDELDKMTEQFNPIMEKLEINSKQIQTLENLRDTLLPKLLSGEVRI